MKKSFFIIAALIVTGFMLQAGQVKAQELSANEQKVLQEELKKAQKEQIREQEKLRRDYEREFKVVASTPHDFDFGYVAVPPPPSIIDFGSEKSFKLSLRKKFNGESISKKTNFTVEKDQKRLKLSITSSLREGELDIKFTLPSGKLFKKITIDPSADITWSQSFKIEEDSKYVGQWNVEINARKPVGVYTVDITGY